MTAYADAKAHGYTGTREEFGVLLANAGLNLKAAETAKEGAEAAKQAAETAQQAAAENQKNTETQSANAKAAADSAANAAVTAKQAQQAAETAKADAEAAKTTASNSADAAANSATAAQESETNASQSSTAAANSAADAKKTLESIPADYSTLSGKVTENTSGISKLKEDLSNKITKFYASSQGETHLADSDNGKIQDMMIYGKSSQDETPTLENPVEIKSVVNPTVKVTNEDNVNVQSFTVNDVTLCAVPVKKGGNITVNGQQYIADYIDVENGKIVKYVKKLFLKPFQWSKAINKGVLRFYGSTIDAVGLGGDKVIENPFPISSHFAFVSSTPDRIGTFTVNADGINANIGFAFSTDVTTSSDDFNNWILNNKPFVFLPVLKEELPLASEQILALKKLSTYYPVTNISINSEQLDGYAVFNYPISMKNGWDYVKKQLNDNRDYIYNMDIKTQDIDTQAAEAYVNSEYAAALTELEV